MILSEVQNEFYVITWDNPSPKNSKSMRRALDRIGKVQEVHAKTTIKLFPKSTVKMGRIRRIVRMHLDPLIGRAVIVGVHNRRVSHIDNAIRPQKWTRV